MDQNGDAKPSCLKMASTCSIVLPWYSGNIRLSYQICASSQTWLTDRISPRSTWLAAHQRSTDSSDRKKRIVAQVNNKSSYQRRNGTRKWTTSPWLVTLALCTDRSIDCRLSGHVASIVASQWSAAGMPSASQAQLAQ